MNPTLRSEEPVFMLKQVAQDFGISESYFANWIHQVGRDVGIRSGRGREELAELRELKRRNRLLEQENEVLGRAAAYLAGEPANL